MAKTNIIEILVIIAVILYTPLLNSENKAISKNVNKHILIANKVDLFIDQRLKLLSRTKKYSASDPINLKHNVAIKNASFVVNQSLRDDLASFFNNFLIFPEGNNFILLLYNFEDPDSLSFDDELIHRMAIGISDINSKEKISLNNENSFASVYTGLHKSFDSKSISGEIKIDEFDGTIVKGSVNATITYPDSYWRKQERDVARFELPVYDNKDLIRINDEARQYEDKLRKESVINENLE